MSVTKDWRRNWFGHWPNECAIWVTESPLWLSQMILFHGKETSFWKMSFFFFFIKNCFNWCAYERPKERITKYRETLLLISVEPVSVSSFPLTIVICLTNIISIAVNYWCFCVFCYHRCASFHPYQNLLPTTLFQSPKCSLTRYLTLFMIILRC